MNLSLPFYDSTLGIGDSGGGWFRNVENDGGFHGGWDVMPKAQTAAADLFDVCAAADGVVIGITKQKNCPIVIRHHAGGTEFLTIYQHLDLRSCALNVNDAVNRGQFLAKITDEKEVPDPAKPHVRHLHFVVAAQGPAFRDSSGKTVPKLWYAIDPFGVYDYYKNRDNLQTYNYLPDKRPDCFTHLIQGSSHIIQWATQPLVDTIPIVRQTAYLTIVRMQMRVRSDVTQGVPPAEANQCLVWLEGIERYFFVPFDSPSHDLAIELKMVDFLLQCFDANRKVKVEYYPVGAYNFISAVWAND
jgi:hypothetical protein